MKKVLFFDVDGTLISPLEGISVIPDGVKEQMRRLQEKGYYLFIASGRPKAFLSPMLLDAHFDGYVLCNGAHVELNGDMIFKQPLDQDKLTSFVQLLTEKNCEYNLETEDKCYLNPKFTVLDTFFKKCAINVDKICYQFDLDEAITKTLKIEVKSFGEDSQLILDYVKDRFNYDCHGTEGALEIYAKEVSKATGIQKVLDYFHLSKKDSYAFGDGLNDLEMIEYVGCGVAMGNAVEKLKEKADLVCKPIHENGLENVLKQLFE